MTVPPPDSGSTAAAFPAPAPTAPAGPLAGVLDHPLVGRVDALAESIARPMRGVAPLDRLFYGLSAVGDHGIAWHVVGVARALLGIDTWGGAVELSAALGVEAAVVNGPIKWLFRRVRPTHDGPRPHGLRTPRTSSFPSGHASSGMFAAALVARRSQVSWPWYALGAAIGWSRVHVRIHHGSDVVAGYAVGAALGAAAARLLDRQGAQRCGRR